MKYSFFKEEKVGVRTQITFIGKELKIYLPKTFLEKGSIFGTILGDKISTIGLFYFETEGKFYELTLPVYIEFLYSEQEKFKGKLTPKLPNMEYDVFILRKNDIFIHDIMHIQKVDDLETMLLKIVDQGKMPATVSYADTLNIILQLLLVSGVNDKLGAASAIIEILLSELYRNKNNPNEPFRKLITKNKNASPYDFKMIRMQKIPQLNSIFNSLIGEDMYNQIASSVVRYRDKTPDNISPIEKLIKL